MFGTLGGPELFLILVVALIVFGPRKLPEIGKSLGQDDGGVPEGVERVPRTIENEVEAEKIRDVTRIETPRLDAAAERDEPARGDAGSDSQCPGRARGRGRAPNAVGDRGGAARRTAAPIEPK